MTQDKSFLGTQPVGKLLVKLAVPTVISQIVNMLYNIIDRVYIGHIPGEGSLALTGMGICMPIILIISAFAALVASGGAPRASICMGKGDNESAEKYSAAVSRCKLSFRRYSPLFCSFGTSRCLWRSAQAKTQLILLLII